MSILSQEKINQLESQGCESSDWSKVTIDNKTDLKRLKNVIFSGQVSIGILEKNISLVGGIDEPSSIKNVHLHNCKIGDNVLIRNIHNFITNYEIANGVVIINTNFVGVDQPTHFGNGTNVAVLNEDGGRELQIFNELSAHFAYFMTFYRHKPLFITNLKKIVTTYCDSQYSSTGKIGESVLIINSGTIKNVNIGAYATIDSAKLLENGTIMSTQEAPVHIGYNVIANDFIVSSGSRITDGVMIDKCFVGQACKLGHTYSATDSLFFSNCQGENGEACSVFAGPYTVTHHKSTLLIAGMFSFMNAGSSSNQSNHMYKLGPIHQGIVERGGKTTSNSYILWPSRIGAFSLIMGRHKNNADTSKLPFSYLIESGDESVLVPAVNLRSVGTIRDAQKFPKRDKRKDADPQDSINFNLLSPYTVQKMFQGIDVLSELIKVSGGTCKTYTYQGCIIKNTAAEKGISLYHIAIKKFLGNSLISRINGSNAKTFEELKAIIKPTHQHGLGKWNDLSGLLIPRSKVDELISLVEDEKFQTVREVNQFLKEAHKDYYDMEWTWAWDKIQSYFDITIDTLTVAQLIQIVEEWKDVVVTLDKMIYADAKKEFSLSSRIGFGHDGDRYAQQIDFDQVRGVFEENQFVKMLLQHIDTKTDLGNSMIQKLQNLTD